MRRISYSGASFLTADAVADALFRLVSALGVSQTTEMLSLPAKNITGTTIIVKLIVGPMSELISVPEESLWDDPEDDPDVMEVLDFLRDRTHVLNQPKPAPAFSETIATTDFDSRDIGRTQ